MFLLFRRIFCLIAPFTFTEDASVLLPPLPRSVAQHLARVLPVAAHSLPLLRPRPAPVPLAPAPLLLATVPAAASVSVAAPAAVSGAPGASFSSNGSGATSTGTGAGPSPTAGGASAASGALGSPVRAVGSVAQQQQAAVAAAAAAAAASVAAAAQTTGAGGVGDAAQARAAALRELPAGAFGLLLIDDVTPASHSHSATTPDNGSNHGRSKGQAPPLCEVKRRAAAVGRGGHGSDELEWPRVTVVERAHGAAVALVPSPLARVEPPAQIRRGAPRAPMPAPPKAVAE